MTYTKDGRVIRDLGTFGLWLGRFFFDAQILHITTAEDNVFVYAIGRRDLFLGVLLSPFGTKG